MANEQQPARQPPKRVAMSRYAVWVDRQAKSSYDTPEAAEKEARRISEAFPILTVEVVDLQRDSITTNDRAPSEEA